MTDIGAHLLGRIPSPPDARDYRLIDYLADDPLDAALLVLQASHQVAAATKAWAAVATPRIKAASPQPGPAPGPPPPPPPPAPTGDVIWQDAEAVLDQGNFGTCVGNGWAQWGNTLPIDDKFVELDARKIYFEATTIDGHPDDPDAAGGGQQGSTVRSGAKAMQNRFRLQTYAFAASVDEARAWLRTKGPVVFGTDWLEQMFTVDANGYVQPLGAVAGGHCYTAVGDLESEQAALLINSWGSSWGLKGYFKMKWADLATLFASSGEACVAAELP